MIPSAIYQEVWCGLLLFVPYYSVKSL
jgi:hypothetical protein